MFSSRGMVRARCLRRAKSSGRMPLHLHVQTLTERVALCRTTERRLVFRARNAVEHGRFETTPHSLPVDSRILQPCKPKIPGAPRSIKNVLRASVGELCTQSPEYRRIVGETIRTYRKQAGLTQERRRGADVITTSSGEVETGNMENLTGFVAQNRKGPRHSRA